MIKSVKDLYGYLRGSGDLVEEPQASDFAEEDPVPPEARDYLTVKLKKKRQQLMLKKMLSDGGYADLSKMVTFGKEKRDDEFHND